MANANGTSPAPPEFIGNFKTDNGGHISIERGDAVDYAHMRATQLAGLLALTVGEGGESFRRYSDTIQENVLWLARNLADELANLVPIIDADAVPTKKEGPAMLSKVQTNG